MNRNIPLIYVYVLDINEAENLVPKSYCGINIKVIETGSFKPNFEFDKWICVEEDIFIYRFILYIKYPLLHTVSLFFNENMFVISHIYY